jgi:hypothetical protein
VTHDDAQALDQKIRAALGRQRHSELEIAMLLAEMEDTLGYRELGFARLADYAATLGLAPRKAGDRVRVARRLDQLPEMRARLTSGELDWSRARALVAVVTPQTEAAWVDRARTVTCTRLEQEIASARRGDLPDDNEPVRGPARRRIVLDVEASDAEAIYSAIALFRAQLGAGDDEVDNGTLLAAICRNAMVKTEPEDAPTAEPYRIVVQACPGCGDAHGIEAEVSDTVASEARCDAEVIDMTPGPRQGHATRVVAPALKRRVLHRHGWKCAVPHCKCRLWLHIHHLDAWADGGRTTDENLVPLCSIHHRIVHDGRLSVQRLSGRIVVEHGDGRRFVGAYAP